ncbi:MAG: transposase [Bacillales bacterium]|nr:transposase [Bacillales bacterium]
MWNTLLAGIIFQHDSDAKLLRELSRNGQLQAMSGFKGKAPTPWAFSRFLKRVLDEASEVEAIFDQLVEHAKNLLPDFGKRLAMDSKGIDSFASRKNKNEKTDGRRDLDADYGKKVYHG